MICYRDMTFCPFWGSCEDGVGCPRSLTEKVREQAAIWWGSQEAPICQYGDKPDCFEPIIREE